MAKIPDERVYAITMWDFSWLERRWSGAGYEDWREALEGLVERGYDAVRIDAYPHLIGADLNAEHELIPVWGVNDWGAYMQCRVQPYPALIEFISLCAELGIKVGLSSWYRRDTQESWRKLFSPERHAASWIRVVELIEKAGLLEHILYLDFCNEWPMQMWAPYFHGTDDRNAAATMDGQAVHWDHPQSLQWMEAACSRIRSAYPDLPLTFSIHSFDGPHEKVTFLDFFEPHIWMAPGPFYQRLGWTFQHKFDNSEFEQVQKFAEPLYRQDEGHWLAMLDERIDAAAASSRKNQKPLVTTECWGIIDYKDGPGLDWGWVKEACAHGTRRAAATGAWWAIATSNFCGPQFIGMWRDVTWHQELTKTIKSSRRKNLVEVNPS